MIDTFLSSNPQDLPVSHNGYYHAPLECRVASECAGHSDSMRLPKLCCLVVFLCKDRVALAHGLGVPKFSRCKQRSAFPHGFACTYCDKCWTRLDLPSQALVLDDKCVPFTLERTNCSQDVLEGGKQRIPRIASNNKPPTGTPEPQKPRFSIYQDVHITAALSSIIIKASSF